MPLTVLFHAATERREIGTLSDPRFWFYRSVLDEVRKVLEERKIGIDIWVDPRKESERTKIMEGLENAACKRDIQGIIILAQGVQYLHWTRTIPLPVAELSPIDAPFAVNLDVKQMGEMSVARLAEMGCKTIGLISGRFVRDRAVTGNANAGSNAGFYEGFMGAVKAHGLKIKDSWMRLPPRVLSEFEYGDFGNKQFNALWNLKQRPEGILIEPDIVMEGVIPAMLQHQVQPDDLKIVMHRNQNHPLICPFPASVVISSERDCAEALVRQLDNQLAGLKRAPFLVPYQFEK